MVKKYALLHGDEDGNCITFLDDQELQELLDDPEGNYGITDFVDELSDYPENWSEAEGMIVEIKQLKPKQKTVAWRLEE